MGAIEATPGGVHDSRVLILGPVRLIDASVDDVVMSSVGQRRLVAALSVADGLARAEWLGEALGLSMSALRTAISRLRSRVSSDIVITDGAGYRLGASCDADDVVAMLDAPDVGEARLETLERALALWAGDAIAEFAHEPWAEAQAARLNELRVIAREERAALLIALGRSGAAVPDLEALAAANPLRDRVCGLLMQALAVDGREADALRSFQDHRTKLIDEAGLEPSLALREIEQRISRGESDEQHLVIAQLSATNRWHTPGNAGPTQPAQNEARLGDERATNVAEQPTRLFGRDDVLLDAQRALHDHRLITLTGPGGIGKTRLARHLGLAELDRMSDGVWFVDLSSASTATQVVASIAEGCRLPTAGPDPAARLLEFLAQLDALVILDNCEHLVDEVAGFLERLLAQPGRCRIVATSREFLDIEGERVIRLSPLASAHRNDPAIELFVERAKAANPSFDVDDASSAAVAALCQRLDGLPLAIELAAARSNVLSPQQLLDGIDSRFELLRGGRRRRTSPVLYDTLEWSYDLLDPVEQRVLRALGCFAGSFTIEAVGHVTSLDQFAALEIVEALIAKSLAVGSPTTGGVRFRLLESTRAFAQRRLDEHDERDEVCDRHLEYFIERTAPYVPIWTTKVGDRALAPDVDNVRAAAGWAATHERWDEVAHLLAACWQVLAADAVDFERRAVDCVAQLDPDSEPAAALNMARMLVAIEADHPAILRVVRPALVASPVAKAQLLLDASAAVMIARRDPVGALRAIEDVADQLRHQASPDDTEEVHHVLLYATVAAHNGQADFARVIEASRALDAAFGEGTTRSSFQAAALAAEAIAQIALDQRAQALAICERLDSFETGWIAADELRIILHLDGGELDQAVRLLRPYCREAVSGRFTRQSTAAVIYLAFLAYAEGDKQRATDFIQGIDGVSFMQAHAALHLLCDRLGIEPPPQRAANHELKDVRARQRQVLAAELQRRGWAEE